MSIYGSLAPSCAGEVAAEHPPPAVCADPLVTRAFMATYTASFDSGDAWDGQAVAAMADYIWSVLSFPDDQLSLPTKAARVEMMFSACNSDSERLSLLDATATENADILEMYVDDLSTTCSSPIAESLGTHRVHRFATKKGVVYDTGDESKTSIVPDGLSDRGVSCLQKRTHGALQGGSPFIVQGKPFIVQEKTVCQQKKKATGQSRSFLLENQLVQEEEGGMMA